MSMNIMGDTTNNTVNEITNSSAYSNHKKWLLITLAAAALTLSACGKQDEEQPIEGSALEFDSETSEAEAAAEIAEANAPMISDREDNPISPSNDEPEGAGAIIGVGNEPDKDITGGVGSTNNPETPDISAAPADKNEALAGANEDGGTHNSTVLVNEDP